MDTLISEIEAFMTAHNMSQTAFGHSALRDRHFVRQLREGRDVKMSTAEHVRNFMATYTPNRDAAA